MNASVTLLWLLLLCTYNAATAFVPQLPSKPHFAIAPGTSWRNPAAYANKRRLQPQIELCMIRHGDRLKTMGRMADHRKATLRAVTTSVLRYGSIRTTILKAKETRRWVDKMIGLAKRGTLHARRQALAFVYDKQLVHNLFITAPERYANRTSGFCRVKRDVEEPFRRGDRATMVYLELV